MTSYFIEKDDAFKRFLIISVGLHFSFVIFTVAKNLIMPSTEIIIPNAVRVDMVGLPDKMPEVMPPPSPEKPKTPPKEAAKEKPKEIPKKSEPKKESLQEAKESQKKALEKLNAMNAIEKMKNEVIKEKQAQNTTATPPQYKGNIISSGNSFTGMSRLRVNDYLENLTSKIRDNWVLPQWLSDAQLKVAIVIEVDSRGYVIRKEIHTSSGNSVFDSSCLAAVEQASPFPDPPNEVQGALIMIRFPFE